MLLYTAKPIIFAANFNLGGCPELMRIIDQMIA
jgi:hypothetical protein